MAKRKYELTADLVKVEPEPISLMSNINKETFNEEKRKKSDSMERVTINIDSDLKYKLQIYALNNRKKMTDVLLEAIKEKVGEA